MSPFSGRIVDSSPSCTSATSVDSRKTSSIDQRPIASTIRCSLVRPRSAQALRRCVVTIIRIRAISLAPGTMMLAKNTSTASGHMPASPSCLTVLMIVSGWLRP